jgi:pimeloyl-ACP methyl ester carboxylesterase
MRKVVGIVVLVLAPTLGACELHVSPAKTDPRIHRGLDDHLVVFDEHRPLGDRLFVFFPGTGGTPEGYPELLREVAAQGMPAIGLMYPSVPQVGSLCARDGSEPDCTEQVREERIYGVDTSSKVQVSPANSIVNRLVKLLQYLHWADFLDGDQPRWDHIVVAGHSQGGGHAAMLARDHLVARVVFLASPGDQSAGPAPWLLEPRATPANRYFGFGHRDDGPSFFDNWTAMGVPGPLTSVDGASPPYGGSHQLVTDAPAANPHLAVAHKARYTTVWDHLCCS